MIDKPYTHPKGHEFFDLVNRLARTPDHLVGDSAVFKELIGKGSAGIETIKARLSKISNKTARIAAFFNMVVTCYELGQKEEALANVDNIENQSERNRCLVQLACLALEQEESLTKAEEFIARVEEDKEGYLNYYQKIKKRLGFDTFRPAS